MDQNLMNRIQAMMQQRGASGNGIMGYASGGGVPRQTMIADQPHMLAYINPEEEMMLQDYRQDAPTVPGPGNIPSYYYGQGMASTAGNKTFEVSGNKSGSGGRERKENEARKARDLKNAAIAAAAAEKLKPKVTYDFGDDDEDDYTSADLTAGLAEQGLTNIIPGPLSVDAQVAQYTADDYKKMEDDTAVSGFEYGFNPGSGTLGSNEIAQPFNNPSIGGFTPSNNYDADTGEIAQGNTYGAMADGSQLIKSFQPGGVEYQILDPSGSSVTNRFNNYEEAMAFATGNPISQGVDYSTAGSFNTDSAETSALLSELGYGSDGSGLGSGATPQAITNLALGNGVPTEEEITTFRDEEAAYGGGQPVIGGGMEPEALKASMLDQVKGRVSTVEGTSDEGGYDRLLGGQEDNFDIKPTQMTVQEILNFQNERGDGTYAGYSQGVNEKRGFFRDDGSPRISTPVGKYQVVGSNLQQMVNDGIIDPNALFNEDTQEKIGSYLINDKRSFDDYLDGNITLADFEEGLGNEFEGIAIEGLYGDDQPTTAVASLAPDISLRPASRQLASAKTTGETSGEILARLAAQRESDREARDTSGDVQVAAIDSRGPLSDTITSNLNLDEIDSNIINASVTGGDDLPLGPFSSRESMDDYFGVGKESISGLDLLDSEIAKDSGRTIEDDREYLLSPSQDSALDYYTTGAGATGSGVNPFDSYTTEQAKDFRESPGNIDMSGLDSFSDDLADAKAKTSTSSSGSEESGLDALAEEIVQDKNKDQGTKYRSAPNAAETAQLTEVVKRLGSEPMTKEYQDGIVAEMKKNGATATEIADYRKYSPVGSDINPFYDTFTETLNDKTRTITGKDGTKVTLDGKEYSFMDKAAAALRNILNFGISSLTYGLVDPAEMDRTKAEKYMEALQETGTYAYGSEDDLDISPGAEGDANFEKLEELTGNYNYTGTENPDGTMSYSGTGVGAGSTLQGVFDAEGNVVEGFNEYRNTPDGAVAVSKEVVREKDKDEFNICEEGFEFDPKEGICMPIASSGGEDTQPILKPRPVRPDTPTPPIDNMPIKPEVEGVKVRKVKQFAQGGSVTPNIDNFLANLGS